MSDTFVHDDNLVASALRLNWDRARHIESQRIQFMAIYAGIAVALGFAAIHPGDLLVRLGAVFLAFCVTVIVWWMTVELNKDFVNQLWHADRCARRLAVQAHDGRNEFIALHGYVGFPRKPSAPFGLVRIDMQLMLNVFYGTAALAWLVLLGYQMFRFFAPAAVL